MSDHREKAKELLLHYFEHAADEPFTNDSIQEIEQIIDEIIEAVDEDESVALKKLEDEVARFGEALAAATRDDTVPAWQVENAERLDTLELKARNTIDIIPLLDKSDAQLHEQLETVDGRLNGIVGNLTETATHVVELEGKVDQLEERRRENDRDRIAINGLRLSVENLTKALGDKP